MTRSARVGGLAGPGVVGLHTSAIGLFVERFRLKFGAVVDGDYFGPTAYQSGLVQSLAAGTLVRALGDGTCPRNAAS